MKTFAPLTAPVDPVTALTRIAWLLERDGQRSYRIEAFRKAAGIVAAMDDDELGRRLRDCTLTEVAGIGTTTASVITEASAGELPDYLDRLQQTSIRMRTRRANSSSPVSARCGRCSTVSIPTASSPPGRCRDCWSGPGLP